MISCTGSASLVASCCTFAALGGIFISLIPTLLAERFGVSRLSETWALTACFVGFFQLIIPTCVGWVKDLSDARSSDIMISYSVQHGTGTNQYIKPQGSWAMGYYLCSTLICIALIVNSAVEYYHMKWYNQKLKCEHSRFSRNI